MFLGLPDPDPLARGMDPDPDLDSLVRGMDPRIWIRHKLRNKLAQTIQVLHSHLLYSRVPLCYIV
jgi:hypothetical protein